MKIFHAAALALMGWYLLVPSFQYDPQTGWGIGKWDDDMKPEFSSWQIVGSYDSAAACKQRRTTLRLVVPPTVTTDRKRYEMMMPQAVKDSVCLASDDPRLKP